MSISVLQLAEQSQRHRERLAPDADPQTLTFETSTE